MKTFSSKPANLPVSIHKRLHTYAVAAGAAGAGVLALAQPAETEIIYTPANAEIYSNTTYNLDLNRDGTTDFSFINLAWGQGSSSWGNLRVGNSQTGNAVVATSPTGSAVALEAGASIGPAANFNSGFYATMAYGWKHGTGRSLHFRCYGPWKDVHAGYLGLRFMINGEVHYGWARLNERCHKGFQTAKLTGYAYETVPDQALEAGQKKEKKGELEGENLTGPGKPTPPSVPVPTAATLGMLARGAQALDIWRRE